MGLEATVRCRPNLAYIRHSRPDSGCGFRVKVLDRLRVGEVSRGEKMLESGTDPESYVTEYTVVYENYVTSFNPN